VSKAKGVVVVERVVLRPRTAKSKG